MREVAQAARRGRDADPFEQLHRPLSRRAPAHAEMRPERLGDLVADAEHRVQGSHRVLEDEPDAGAAHAPQVREVEPDQVFPLEPCPAGDDLRRRHRQELEQRHHGHALARSALAHDPEQLSLAEVEADAVDRVDGAVPGVEAGTDVLDLQDPPARGRLDRRAHRAFMRRNRSAGSCSPAPPPRRSARRSSIPSRRRPRAGSCPGHGRSSRRRPRRRSRRAGSAR